MCRNTSVTGKVLIDLLFLTFFTLAIPSVTSQELEPFNPFAEDDAPRALFQIGPEDRAAELYLLGNWSAGSGFSYGISLHPELNDGSRITAPYEYPGFTTELFYQTVDLTLSLWLFQKFYFEATFLDEALFNSVIAGYMGESGESLQEVMVGRGPFQIGAYPYLGVGADGGTTTNSVPGIYTRFETPLTSHELLFQVDGSFPVTDRYRGTSVISDYRLQGNGYVEGAHFVLPEGNISKLLVLTEDTEGSYIESDSGVLRRYREMTEEEIVVDLTAGEIVLLEPADTRILVSYTDVGTGTIVPRDDRDFSPTDEAPVTFDFTVSPYEDYRVTINETDYLLLYDPARPNYFESLDLYDISSFDATTPADLGTISLVTPEGRNEVDDGSFRFRLRGRGTYLAVEDRSIDRNTESLRTRTGLFPLAEITEEAAAMYGDGRDLFRPVDLLVTTVSESGRIQVESDTIPGSVRVFVNGSELPGVSVDYHTGSITLPVTLSESDRIEVVYRRNDTSGLSPQVTGVIGNRWFPSERASLFLAGMVRWNPWNQGYSNELDENPGTLAASGGFSWQSSDNGSLRIDASGTIQIQHSDTSGYIRLLSMNGETTVISLEPSNLFPAAETEALSPIVLTESNRVIPVYRDYWFTDLLGTVSLLPYSDRSGTVASGRTGPYLAGSGASGISGALGVLEWSQLQQDQWTGAQLQLPGGSVDLRTLEELRFNLRYEDLLADDTTTPVVPSSLKLYLVLGAGGEDLDGDGISDIGSGELQPELPFDFDGNTYLAGTRHPTGTSPYREDANGNGVLEEDEPDLLISLAIDLTTALPSGPDSWETVTVDAFTSLPWEERARLQDSRSVRLIAIAQGGDVPAGRFLFSRVAMDSPDAFSTVSGTNGTSSVDFIDDPPSPAPSVSGDTVDSVARLTWGNVDSSADETPTVTYHALTTPFSPDAYDSLELALLLDTDAITYTGDSEISLVYGDGSDDETEALSATINLSDLPASHQEWQNLSIDLRDETVTLDGTGLPAVVSIPSGTRNLISFTVKITDSSDGVVYFDEIRGNNPVQSTGAAGEVTMGWDLPFSLDGPGELPIVNNIRLRQTVALRSDQYRDVGVSSGGIVSVSGRGTSDTLVSMALLGTTLELKARVTGTAGAVQSSTAGHTWVVPLLEGAVSLLDSYRRSWNFSGDFESRDLSLSWHGERVPGGSLTASLRQDYEEELRKWSAVIAAPEMETLSARLDLTQAGVLPALANDGYGSSWFDATTVLFSPDRMEEEVRSLRIVPNVSIGPVEITGRTGWTNDSAVAGRQTARTTFSVSGEFRNEENRPWTIAPSYSRSFLLVTATESDTFARDLHRYSKDWSTYPNLYSEIPLYDLFSPEIVFAEGADRQEYTTEVFLSFQRPPGSRRRDMIVPSGASLSIDREAALENDSLLDSRTLEAQLTATGINVTGSESTHPLFTWYRSDEILNTLTVDLTTDSWYTGLETGIHLYIAENTKAAWDQEIAISRETSSQVFEFDSAGSLEWKRFSYPHLNLFEELEKEPYWDNRESISLGFRTSDAEIENVKIEFTHESILRIGNHGNIALSSALGWMIKPFSEGTFEHILGIRATIEGTLSF